MGANLGRSENRARPVETGRRSAKKWLASNRPPGRSPGPPPQESSPMPTNGALNRKLRMALVGGGQGAFIGRVHSTAAVLDNRAALVAGALSSDAQRAK